MSWLVADTFGQTGRRIAENASYLKFKFEEASDCYCATFNRLEIIFMRGVPIDRVNLRDIARLIEDSVAEDRRIEFKADIPVSPEEQKVQLKSRPNTRPVDRSWTQGKPLAKYGRDSIAEEVVAFANADGGTVVLGMEETDEVPPRAKAINPLPDVAGLERRLRDVLTACVEPRLPYVAVRALPITEDGSGVILIETGPSALGPHWVMASRRPTIRREDCCVPLSMPEIHEMVLRHARHLDAFSRTANSERSIFIQDFSKYLRNKKPGNIVGDDDRSIDIWFRKDGLAALGVRVAIMPNFDLGIPRLESIDGLVPASNAIRISAMPEPIETSYIGIYDYASNSATKILGGVKAEQIGGFDKDIRVMRDGRVSVSFIQIRELKNCTCSADLVVGASGFALGVFDRLRKRSSYPAAPAFLTLDICVRGHVGVGGYANMSSGDSFGRLAEHTEFPNYILGDSRDISQILQEIAADLMNAGGMSGSHLPEPIWYDPY